MSSVASSMNRKLRIRAADALQRSPIPALRHLTIQETQEHLVLSGMLPSRYYQRLAQDTVQPFLNGRTLLDQVVIEKG